MKKLTLLLAILASSLLTSCSYFHADYSQRMGAARPVPEGPSVQVPFGSHNATVYRNCVHFTLPPNLGLLSPAEVWVYNLDRDSAKTYDAAWIRPYGPDSWEFYQNANLPRGVTATSVLQPADPNTALIWFDNAQRARTLSFNVTPSRPSSAAPKSVPEQASPGREPVPEKGWKRVKTDDGSVIWEKVST